MRQPDHGRTADGRKPSRTVHPQPPIQRSTAINRAAYYIIVLAGLAASLGIIASTLPVLDRITGPETARSE